MNNNTGLLFCLVVVVMLMICLVQIMIMYEKLRRQYTALVESYYDLQTLNGELRSQRHDYLNHLQIVYGMMELEEYGELHDYLEPVYKSMMKTGKAIRTSIPAVNALLMAKMGTAEDCGIDFYVEVKSELKNFRVEPWELCKVLSNLLDNAITALEERKENRKMMLDINEDREAFLFAVSNNGPPIPHEKTGSIFRPGFSTKKEEGHGMGLAIVADILKENNGVIEVESNENETVFTVNVQEE